MNRGIASNTAVGAWKFYNLEIRTVGAGAIQPYFDKVDGHTYQYGRYQQDLGTGWVTGQVQVEMIANTTLGSGDNYIFSLPVPAVRLVPDTTDPHPIGAAMCYWSFSPAPNQNMPCVATLANPTAGLNADTWFQIYAPEILAQGTGSLLATGVATTVSHGLNYAPNAEDIQIAFTGTTIPNTSAWAYISNITSTTFDVRTRTAPSASCAFSWIIRGVPGSQTGGALVGPYVPWAWSRFTSLGPFGNIFVQFAYQGAV